MGQAIQKVVIKCSERQVKKLFDVPASYTNYFHYTNGILNRVPICPSLAGRVLDFGGQSWAAGKNYN